MISVCAGALSPPASAALTVIEAVQSTKATSSQEIVAGNEPAVSGGLGSHAMTHNGDDAM